MPETGGIGKFLQGTTANLPNWAWGLIIVGGIAATIVLPKFIGGKGSSNPSNTADTGVVAAGPLAGNDVTATDTTNNLLQQLINLLTPNNQSGTGSQPATGFNPPVSSGNGVPFSSGLPIASGSGPFSSSLGGAYGPPTGGTPISSGGIGGAPLPGLQGNPPNSPDTNPGSPFSNPPTNPATLGYPTIQGRYTVVNGWPVGSSNSLSSIAANNGLSLEAIQGLNPHLENTVKPGDVVWLS